MKRASQIIKIAISILFLVCLSTGAYSQATVAECFKKPTTIILNSPDLKSDPDFDERLKKIAKNLKEEKKLYVYTYSKGGFGTSGLNTITGTVRSRAEHIFKSKKVYEIKAGGYRFEASIDLFALNAKCQELAGEYEVEPGMSFFEVDFINAPLGLSVFPSGKEMSDKISKEAIGCTEPFLLNTLIGFNIIVGTDGRVLHAEPFKGSETIFAQQARQTLVNWAFNTPVIDDVPRYIRGSVFVRECVPSEVMRNLRRP